MMSSAKVREVLSKGKKMPNFTKGKNAYVFLLAVGLVGVIFWALGHGILWLLPEDSNWRYLADSMLLDSARISFFIAAAGLVFSVAGSFFTFDTDDAINKVFVVLGAAAVVNMAYLGFVIVSDVDILTQPWLGIFFTLVGAFVALFFVPFFLHTARRKSDREDFFDRLAKALKKGRAVLPERDQVH
jgi:hypothetical protein